MKSHFPLLSPVTFAHAFKMVKLGDGPPASSDSEPQMS